MLRYLKNTNSKFKDVTKEAILAGNKPIVLFLGGLLHFNNLQLGPSLSSILDKLTAAGTTGLPTFLATRSGEVDVGKTAGDMYAFENAETISAEARALLDDIILPSALAAADAETMRQHLSRFNIIAYSYGTSLVQQIEKQIFDHLQSRKFARDQIAHTMEGLAALNIGPVARPLIWNEEGLTTRFNRHADHMAPMQSLFSQYFFLRRFDKISNDVLHDKLTHDMANDRAIHLFGSTSSLYICDNTGDDRLRRLGFKALSSGYKFPFITYNMDHEGHDLRLYTNTMSSTDLVATYPSTGTSSYLQSACHHMINESPKAIAGQKRNMALPVKDLGNSDTYRRIEQGIKHLHQHFEHVTMGYSLSQLQHCIEIIQSELAEAAKLQSMNLDFNK